MLMFDVVLVVVFIFLLLLLLVVVVVCDCRYIFCLLESYNDGGVHCTVMSSLSGTFNCRINYAIALELCDRVVGSSRHNKLCFLRALIS